MFKEYRFYITIFLFAIIGCRTNSPEVEQKAPSGTIQITKLSDPPKELLISAHRGGMVYSGYPENCVETFDYIAKQIPGLIIECDVAESSDGVMFLMHDNTIDRTTTGSGKANALAWSALQELKLKDNEGKLTDYSIPTLEDAIDWAKGRALLTLDIKAGVSYQKIIDLVRKKGALDYVGMITYSIGAAEKINYLDPDIMISLNIRNEKELIRAKEADLNMDRIIAFTGTRRKKGDFFKMMKKEGITTIFGTLGNIDRSALKRGNQVYDEFVEQGVNIIATDRPLELAKYLYK